MPPTHNEIGTESNQDLVCERSSVRLVEVLFQVLTPNDVIRVRSSETDIRHDRNQHVFLSVKFPRVERMPASECGESHIRQDFFE